MQLYIYAHSSHREGLENVRRASALCNILKEFGPTLCTGDYRAASIAKDTMGTPRTMGIDAVGNLPFVMERLDMLMYDNEAVTQEMHEQMERFCSRVYNVGKDIPLDTVDESYFGTFAHKREKAFFFADDDYKKWFVDFCKDSQKHNFALIKGNYFFLDALESLEPSFCELIDEEDYKDTIQSTKYLLSASLHTCLESLASGNFPVYFQRADQEMQNKELLEKYNIPLASGETLDAVVESFEKIISSYPHTKPLEKFDFTQIREELSQTFEAYKDILPAIDYGY